MTMWFVKLFLFCVVLESAVGEEEARLEIAQGVLKGIKTTTAYHGMTMYSFKGIPYAAPNVGPNKFRAPLPAEGWSGERDATKHGETCIYFCMIRQGLFGNEDCLFLNVYTPGLDNERRPVMVFLHPGGFNAGSGDDDLHGGDFLVERDVVVVTINYRVGAVGNLNTLDANAPGNAGMKDQVMALKWVQENIMKFGGCKKKVTLFGHSSGAASVQYHLISPMSQGLFRSAIMQSGSAATGWALSYTPREDAMLLGEKVGIQASSTAELVERLAQIPTEDLVVATAELSKSVNFLNGEMTLFKPSVEADFGQEIFLPADPWELIKSGPIADVPIMAGVTADDSGLFTGMVIPMSSQFADHFELFIPPDLNMTNAEHIKMVADMLKDFYYQGKPVDTDATEELTKLLTDIIAVYPVVATNKIYNSRISSPVYEYVFTFQAPLGFMKTLFKLEGPMVVHGDELPYLFYSKFYNNKPAPGSAEEQMTNEMLEMWTNFAKEGNPSATMDVAKVKWEPMGDDDNYLEIGKELTMKKSMFKERVDLWSGIYKMVLGDYAKLF
uniref:Carboxylic ester hydrolase n=1 Tax=Meteorus pulchricornis TaxID=51522 RepID=A0A4D6J7I2_9HYME|nr:carboxylesterase 1 [Meteorus pulchricornis]QCC89028.1 carboxylesterase 13 [Meteorus pulchricornis]